MKPIQLVLFDVTGTLLKPSPSVAVQYAKAAVKHLGFPAKEFSLAQKSIEKSFPNIFNIQRANFPCYGTFHGISSKVWWSQVFSKSIEHCFHGIHRGSKLPSFNTQHLAAAFDDVYTNFEWDILHPETNEVLKRLSNSPSGNSFIRLAAVSNSDNRTAVVMSQKGMLHYFDAVVTSEEAKCEKPDPGIFDYTLDKLQLNDIDRSQVLYVGDTYEKDYVAAKNYGFQAVLLSSDQHLLSKYEQNNRIDNMSGLLQYIHSINAKVQK